MTLKECKEKYGITYLLKKIAEDTGLMYYPETEDKFESISTLENSWEPGYIGLWFRTDSMKFFCRLNDGPIILVRSTKELDKMVNDIRLAIKKQKIKKMAKRKKEMDKDFK